VTSPKSGKYVVAVTSEISLLGCFIKTATPFPPGETVNLRITYDGKVFSVQGAVVYVLPTNGMGINFSAVPPSDQAILERWLTPNLTPLV
jgi:PilZ domain